MANLQDGAFDPMSLPDPPGGTPSKPTVSCNTHPPAENDENTPNGSRDNGYVPSSPISPASPVDKVDEDVDALISANNSLSPPFPSSPILSPLGGGDDDGSGDGTNSGRKHKKKGRRGKRSKKR
jgi:hypothetical protein